MNSHTRPNAAPFHNPAKANHCPNPPPPPRQRPAFDHGDQPLMNYNVAARELWEARDDSLRTRELWRMSQLERGDAGPGVSAIFVEELMDFDEREGTLSVRPEYTGRGAEPAALLRELGVTHVLLVDRISGDGSANLLAPALGQTREVWELGPWREGCAPGEARLPHELHRAVRTLWSVDRPGPRMQLVELL